MYQIEGIEFGSASIQNFNQTSLLFFIFEVLIAVIETFVTRNGNGGRKHAGAKD